ncbi:hypothetical protein ABTG52_11110, partial [Acinetobacter baumannii]
KTWYENLELLIEVKQATEVYKQEMEKQALALADNSENGAVAAKAKDKQDHGLLLLELEAAWDFNVMMLIQVARVIKEQKQSQMAPGSEGKDSCKFRTYAQLDVKQLRNWVGMGPVELLGDFEKKVDSYLVPIEKGATFTEAQVAEKEIQNITVDAVQRLFKASRSVVNAAEGLANALY